MHSITLYNSALFSLAASDRLFYSIFFLTSLFPINFLFLLSLQLFFLLWCPLVLSSMLFLFSIPPNFGSSGHESHLHNSRRYGWLIRMSFIYDPTPFFFLLLLLPCIAYIVCNLANVSIVSTVSFFLYLLYVFLRFVFACLLDLSHLSSLLDEFRIRKMMKSRNSKYIICWYQIFDLEG